MEAAGIDYQKRLAAAQARGDFMEMSRLGQEMAMMSGQMHAQILGDLRQPIHLHVDLNTGASETIDPDAVVIEEPGVLGLRREDGSETTITIYFDPVALKDTTQLSRIGINLPEQRVEKKNAVVNVAITLRGPAEPVETFARSMNTRAILAVIDR